MGKSYWVTNLKHIKSFTKILSELGNVFDEPAGVAVNKRLLCRREVVEGELRKDLSFLTCLLSCLSLVMDPANSSVPSTRAGGCLCFDTIIYGTAKW